MKKLLVLLPLLLIAQTPGVRRPAAPKPETGAKPQPCLQIRGIQVTTIPGSQGGGEYITLDTGAGLVGPFLKLPSLPQGMAYAGTEVAAPSWPGAPCVRGNWARDDGYLYMCLSVPASQANTAGTIWRRAAWDRRWEGTSPGRVR